jgi:hypothetical protein
MSAPDIVEDAFERGRQLERRRCAKIVCPDCAKGIHRDGDMHVLETVQGHAFHMRACLAATVLDGPFDQ